MSKSKRELGLEKLLELNGGAASAERIEASLSRFDPGLADFVIEGIFGGIWARPGLPTRTRSLITVSALIVLARTAELKAHMGFALNVGVTPEELKEVILHLGAYGGAPVAMEARRVFDEVMKARAEKAG